jgi:DNA-directed RNA polymerase I and III subunit RPAC1
MASDLEFLKNRVVLESDRVYSVSSMDVPGTFPGVDDSWDIEKFRKSFKVVISELTKENIEFDLIGIDAAIANAFRRILIAEVPSMAIEDVFILNNTSIMHDEVLAHRLGLIPIKADPNDFSFRWETAQKKWKYPRSN